MSTISKKRSEAPKTSVALSEGAEANAAPAFGKIAGYAAYCLATVVFFLAASLCVTESLKATCLVLCIAAIAAALLRFRTLRERIGAPFLALALYVLMDGVSAFYALSGKFALIGFLYVLAAFCLSLLLLALVPGTEGRAERRIATILEGAVALMSLVSIDLISTHWISGPILAVIERFNGDYAGLVVVVSDRIWTLYDNPNVFACITGLGVLLGLGMVGSAERSGERNTHRVLLYINSLAFLLCVSLGATAFLALAFFVLLLLERPENRAGTLVLMAETFILAIAAAILISRTSFHTWEGFQPLPLVCTILGAAALCLLDTHIGGKAAAALTKRSKLPLLLPAAVVALGVIYAVLAFAVTGPVTLTSEGTLSRSAYPKPGEYTLTVDADQPLEVTIISRSTENVILGSSVLLYQGDADGAKFAVPEDSRVVSFGFSAPEGARLRSAVYSNGSMTGKVPLNYPLLPDFIETRLQGAFANSNSISRSIMATDGLKLFRRSPVTGLGMGAYESAIMSVQSYYYQTKYAHNHYVQLLVETGVVGLALFAGLVLVSAAAVWKSRKNQPLAPALGAALVFMVTTAAREVSFSFYAFLPIAFGLFALIGLCCGGALTRLRPGPRVRTVSVIAVSVLIAVYSIFLGCNLRASAINAQNVTLASLKRGAELDKFEWADYMLGYIVSVGGEDVPMITRQQADRYAERLSQLDSNTIPMYLANYYFETGRTEKALQMIEKSVNYLSSKNESWDNAFSLLETYFDGTEPFRETVREMLDVMEEWNATHIGTVSLSDEHQAFADWLLTQ